MIKAEWTNKDTLDLQPTFNQLATDCISRQAVEVVRCKDCQWCADIIDVDTGEMYHTCGVLGFDIPDGFACNQGKRKGVDDDL